MGSKTRLERPVRLVLATRNPDKVSELSQMLAGVSIELLSCRDFPELPEVVEDGETLEDNAIRKATAVCEATGLPALADDTGLEVEALGGGPGVHSARYAGPSASHEDRNSKLLRELSDVPLPKRGASFRCVVALALPGGAVRTVEGRTCGTILNQSRGTGGFGYDPVFLPEGSDRTYAEMTSSEKNAVSHRGKAMRGARDLVLALLGDGGPDRLGAGPRGGPRQ